MGPTEITIAIIATVALITLQNTIYFHFFKMFQKKENKRFERRIEYLEEKLYGRIEFQVEDNKTEIDKLNKVINQKDVNEASLSKRIADLEEGKEEIEQSIEKIDNKTEELKKSVEKLTKTKQDKAPSRNGQQKANPQKPVAMQDDNKMIDKLSISDLAQEANATSHAKGFWEGQWTVPEKLALIHSEVSEALEKHRKIDEKDIRVNETQLNEIEELPNKKDFVKMFETYVKGSFGDELADILIRVGDLAEEKGIPLEKHVQLKMSYNISRGHKHGKNY
jgi:NTP pyrophosphatase (non-canonical NTP hydrolase)